MVFLVQNQNAMNQKNSLKIHPKIKVEHIQPEKSREIREQDDVSNCDANKRRQIAIECNESNKAVSNGQANQVANQTICL